MLTTNEPIRQLEEDMSTYEKGNDFSKCKFYNTSSGGTNPYHIVNTYGGIPQNLLTNIIGVIILVVSFIVVRKNAWKVINKIVNKDDVEKWTQVFFPFRNNNILEVQNQSGGEEDNDGGQEDERPQTNGINPDDKGDARQIEEFPESEIPGPSSTTDFYVDKTSCRSSTGEDTFSSYGSNEEEEKREILRLDMTSSSPPLANRLSHQTSILDRSNQSFGLWLKSIFTATDEDIVDRCGDDALQYIRLQRHIICYLLFVTILSIGVILPLNFQGQLQGNENSFEHTTLVNLDPESDLLWIHVCLAFLFFPLCILIMRKFSTELKFTEVNLELNRTLMIAKIPKNSCRNQDDLRTHFREAFPTCEIIDLKFAYNVSKLIKVQDSLDLAASSFAVARRREALGKEPITMYPKQCSRCSHCFCWCFCVESIDAYNYYHNEQEMLETLFKEEKDRALETPVGVAFITFESVNMSKEVYDSHQKSCLTLCYRPPSSSLSGIVKPENWDVSFAPDPEDIYWENLSVSKRFLTFKLIAVNSLLFLVAFFFTTPEILANQSTNLVNVVFNETLKLPSPVIDFIPTLLLWSFTALLPLLVAFTDRYLGHWSRSVENHAIMRKTFWYLIFMVILLPTFGLTSAEAALQFVINGNSSEIYRWECIFLPDSGAFYVNYVITAALVGAGFELIRLPDLLFYGIYVCWSKSRAETPYIRNNLKYEFRFGEQYARIMLLFCITIVYCVSCPLITPFGVLYFVTKHYVDRHNLLYAYKPSKINKKVHVTAISFVILSTVMLQFFMMMFSIIRGGSLASLTLRSKVTISFFLLSVNIFSAQLWSETCKKFSPIVYMECTNIRDDQADGINRERIYLPEVLMSKEEKEHLKQINKRKLESEIKEKKKPGRRISHTINCSKECVQPQYGTF